jgi:hypothetical protein
MQGDKNKSGIGTRVPFSEQKDDGSVTSSSYTSTQGSTQEQDPSLLANVVNNGAPKTYKQQVKEALANNTDLPVYFTEDTLRAYLIPEAKKMSTLLGYTPTHIQNIVRTLEQTKQEGAPFPTAEGIQSAALIAEYASKRNHTRRLPSTQKFYLALACFKASPSIQHPFQQYVLNQKLSDLPEGDLYGKEQQELKAITQPLSDIPAEGLKQLAKQERALAGKLGKAVHEAIRNNRDDAFLQEQIAQRIKLAIRNNVPFDFTWVTHLPYDLLPQTADGITAYMDTLTSSDELKGYFTEGSDKKLTPERQTELRRALGCHLASYETDEKERNRKVSIITTPPWTEKEMTRRVELAQQSGTTSTSLQGKGKNNLHTALGAVYEKETEFGIRLAIEFNNIDNATDAMTNPHLSQEERVKLITCYCLVYPNYAERVTLYDALNKAKIPENEFFKGMNAANTAAKEEEEDNAGASIGGDRTHSSQTSLARTVSVSLGTHADSVTSGSAPAGTPHPLQDLFEALDGAKEYAPGRLWGRRTPISIQAILDLKKKYPVQSSENEIKILSEIKLILTKADGRSDKRRSRQTTKILNAMNEFLKHDSTSNTPSGKTLYALTQQINDINNPPGAAAGEILGVGAAARAEPAAAAAAAADTGEGSDTEEEEEEEAAARAEPAAAAAAAAGSAADTGEGAGAGAGAGFPPAGFKH